MIDPNVTKIKKVIQKKIINLLRTLRKKKIDKKTNPTFVLL